MLSKEKNLANTKEAGILLDRDALSIEGEEREESMSSKERLMVIRQNIQNMKKVSVAELSRQCAVTEETIRRDLDKLELEGVVTRIHGGAIWNADVQKENVHFYKRLTKHLKEKQNIARKTAALLEGRNTIIADSSTTVVEALKLIPDNRDVTIVTNSTEVFREFQQSSFNIISTGGEFNKKSLSLQGQLAKTNIAKYNVSIALISCKSLNIEKGVLDSNESEAEIKKLMLEQAEEVALLADYSKFDQTAFVCLTDLKSVNYIITDRRPGDTWIRYCEENGIQLIY
ncbi:DeoR/GlpR transcriptional regulator [Schaedlerella arabinosiphila]|uniref:DeoR/GlpR transcriptional regulator n=1 Tax=Schaedlerella arabinosiphila TaxID=2044587 RepID=A0A9X5C864_9FIRM|nr:DeoR/GlpR family DNA-binding transcription regulator [Schaedlerella arabinosiphila]KAI4440516.1 putative HTH-type transcriptional regulator YdjF [Schaedlerella arabinosiphila]NDO69617.1 DeoR/GlpR transcriptional regulator [Schaedlerella arabinosiphila]